MIKGSEYPSLVLSLPLSALLHYILSQELIQILAKPSYSSIFNYTQLPLEFQYWNKPD